MAVSLDQDRARRLRMAALLLAPDPAGRTAPADPLGIVTHLGAMQAQDVESGLWSLGLRMPGATRPDVLAALEAGTVLRTWPMRGTVHLVPARDTHWMLETTGTRALEQGARRRAAIGLTDADAERAVDAIRAALTGRRRLSRAALLDAVRASGLDVAGPQAYHLLWYASQLGVSVMAPDVDGEQTFVLLDEWVPDPVRLDPDEALAMLARRYFLSHGPATLADFAGWTGLTMARARTGLRLAAPDLVEATVDGAIVWLDPSLLDTEPQPSGMLAAPGFDELILGVKDRTRHLAGGDLAAVVPGGNGIFRSTLVLDGRVIGTWTRATRGRRGAVEVQPLRTLTQPEQEQAEAALAAWAVYADVPLTVTWNAV